MWMSRQLFLIQAGLLYRIHPDTRALQLVVTSRVQSETLRRAHDIPTAGHQGVKRTKERLRGWWWYRCSSQIKSYVNSCSRCNSQKKSLTRTPRYPMAVYHASTPMERVHLDFLGPLPQTPRGNVYVLMMVDQFAKWVECIPLPSQTAERTATAAVNEFFSRFGCPLHIFTDQGRNFESTLFKSLCERLKFQKYRTTPYHPSSNGQVERFNRTLLNGVRCYLTDRQDRWDNCVPQIAAAIRASVNRHTGFTPNKLMLGR